MENDVQRRIASLFVVAFSSLTPPPSQGRGVYLSGTERKQVATPQEVHRLIKAGNAVRATASTMLNERSSRSHAILTLEIETMSEDAKASKVRMGKLNIVDLAGSERVQMSGVVGEALAEVRMCEERSDEAKHCMCPGN